MGFSSPPVFVHSKKNSPSSSSPHSVGKSTTAVNLALAFKNIGQRTGLLDLDVQGPSVPKMMNLHKMQALDSTPDGQILPAENYGVKAMSIGMLLADDKSVAARGPMIGQQVQQLLQKVDWGELDILCLDMPPGTHDVHITTAQQVSLDGAVIVTTPQEIAAMDTRRGMDMFRDMRVPILGLVENMSHFMCPNCDAKHYLYGDENGAEKAAERFQVEFLGSCPFDLQNRAGGDSGVPVTHMGEDGSPLAKPYFDIARKILAMIKADDGLEIVFEREGDDITDSLTGKAGKA